MKEFRPALVLFLLFFVLTGLAYPLSVTGLGQFLFPHRADGSLVERDGRVIGSELIGQAFTRPEYFHPRPSAAGQGYDASASGGSNLAPSNKALIEAIGERTAAAARDSGGRPVPIDLVTASGSGLDPHISPRSALLQVSRVARTRRLPEDQVRTLVEQHVEQPAFDILGRPRVNVLALNLSLDAFAKRHHQTR
jgi:K+-transporting ATPase ATPase C chain